jgi:PAS domain S-box-containing protein
MTSVSNRRARHLPYPPADQPAQQETVLPRRPRHAWLRYGTAVLAVAAATGARVALYGPLHGGQPFLTFFPAVIVATLYGGLGPGLLSVALSVFAAALTIEPVLTLTIARRQDGLALGLFLGVGLAIVWVCEQSRRAHRRTSEATFALAAIVESSDDAIIGKDLAGTVRSWNSGAERLYGYAAEEAVGRPIAFVIPPERTAEEAAILDRVRRGERVPPYDTVRVRKDGAEVQVSVTVSPVRDADGRVVGASKIARDITERQRVALELKQAAAERERLLERERAARAEAERASGMKDEFLATLSHELRTPLNAILGWAQLLRTIRADPQELGEGLETIERNARAQTRIIDDLLDMSRIIAGKVRLDVQAVDLGAVVAAALETVWPAAEAKGISVIPVLDSHAGSVSGDPGRLQQVFWNLLINAIKFTPRGGRVQVVLQRVGHHVEVGITDTGEGISPDFLPHVFDRFRQSDASTTRRHGGLGLGLALVKQLVELHGGRVRATSPGVGRGATFVVELPVATGLARRPAPEHATLFDSEDRPPPDRPCVSLRGVRVLLVEDDPDARALVKRVLSECHAEVTTAASAAEALDLLRADRPDVLVSDIGMPGQDGYELIRQFRAMGNGARDVPAVALTAYAGAEDRERAILAGYQVHVAKPVEPAELVATVAKLAGKRVNDLDLGTADREKTKAQ